jgi:hypothetical protein
MQQSSYDPSRPLRFPRRLGAALGALPAALVGLPAAFLGAAWLSSAVALESGPFQDDDPEPTPTVQLRTEVDRYVAQMVDGQGGVEALASIDGLSFELRPFRFDEDGLPIPGTPLRFSVLNDREEGRQIRLEQTAGEYDVVALFGSRGREVFVDGQPMRDREIGADALQAAALLNRFFDLNFGAQFNLIKLSFEGKRSRGGEELLSFRPTFPPSEEVRENYRIYVHPKSSRVVRYDVFDPETNRRTRTAVLSGFPEGKVFAFPERVDFQDRERRNTLRWEFVDLAINPDFPEGFFEQP